jgi:hypothetical protein
MKQTKPNVRETRSYRLKHSKVKRGKDSLADLAYENIDPEAFKTTVDNYSWNTIGKRRIQALVRKVCAYRYGYMLIDKLLQLRPCPLCFEDFAFISSTWQNQDYALTGRCIIMAEKIGRKNKRSGDKISRVVNNFRTKGFPSWEAMRFMNSP